MMLEIAIGSATGLGTTLVLSDSRRFARRKLTDRLRPTQPTRTARHAEPVDTTEILRRTAQAAGDRISRALGVATDLETRLRRLHSPLDAAAFRLRQVGWAVLSLALGTAASLVLQLGVVAGGFLASSASLLSFLVLEQHSLQQSRDRQQRIALELPVVSEQLSMLLVAGYSLTSALDRIAQRSSGVLATDFRVVVQRVRHGLSVTEALREWSCVADVDAVSRLVQVLELHHHAADLGALVGAEARTIRADAHRDLIEEVERRGQLVWVPVTVATLVPGVVLVALPFLGAMRLLTGA